MKKIIKIAAVMTLAALVAIYVHSLKKYYVQDSILRHLEVDNEFDFAKSLDFEWDKFVVLSPYTTCVEANKIIDQQYFNCSSSLSFPLESSDSFSLMVFLNNGKVVRQEEIARSMDFEPTNKIINKDSAKFNVIQVDNRTKLILKHN